MTGRDLACSYIRVEGNHRLEDLTAPMEPWNGAFKEHTLEARKALALTRQQHQHCWCGLDGWVQ